MQKDKGFSLIEMMVVIAIIGIVSAIAIPNYTSWLQDMRLKAAVRELKSNMHVARLSAIRENATVAVVFTLATNSYEIFVDNGGADSAGTPNNWVRDGSELQLRLENLPAGVTMRDVSFIDDRCRFDGRGIPSPSDLSPVIGLADVRMENTKHNFRGISLSRVGTVRIQTSTTLGGTWENVDR